MRSLESVPDTDITSMSREEPEARPLAGAWTNALCLVALLVPPLCYGLYVIPLIVNAPNWDDYDSVLKFMNSWANSDSSITELLFAQHNEHRVAVLKLFSLASFILFGELDFSFLCYSGFFSLLALSALIWRCFLPRSAFALRGICFLPFMFIVFQPQAYDTPLWPTVCIANWYTLLFAAASFWLLWSPIPYAIPIAFVSQAAAIFCQGNGMFSVPVSVVALALGGRRKESLIWAIASALVIYAYFWNFRSVLSMQLGLSDFHSVAGYFLSYVGGTAGLYDLRIAQIWGASICLAFAWLCLRCRWNENRLLMCCLFFLFLSAASNTLSRWSFGAGYALLQPRYKFYAAMLPALIYLCWIQSLGAREARLKFFCGFLPLAVGFWLASFRIYGPMLRAVSDNVGRGMLYWHIDRQHSYTGHLFYPQPEYAGQVLAKSIEKGVYDFRPEEFDRFFAPQMLPALSGASRDAKLAFQIDAVEDRGAYTYLTGWAYIEGRDALNQEMWVVMEGEGTEYLFRVEKLARPDVSQAHGNPNLDNSGFKTIIPERLLPAGEYLLGLRVKREEQIVEMPAGRRISISHDPVSSGQAIQPAPAR